MSLLALLVQATSLMGQSSEPETDDAAIRFGTIDDAVAGEWAKLVLGAIDTEFPNKLSLVYVDADQLKTPQENFPAFYGCFDWHSSVHGHWLLARLLRTHPSMEAAPKIRTALATHLTRENIQRETEFFRRDEHKTFERMYGWAWYLRLVLELDDWDNADAQTWRENLRPLEALFVQRITAYLPLLTFPIRTGQHTDTGFALGQILDYARVMQLDPLEQLVIDRAGAFYRSDVDYPVQYEPSGHDFFSSGWNEADLMRRVMPQAEFTQWLEKFVPEVAVQLVDGTIAPVSVSDVTDGKLVHLAGLNLNRAWCLRAVANALPEGHRLRRPLLQSAAKHLAAGLAYVNSGHYEGDHWLATFALYAATQTSESIHANENEHE
nr:DUF2891 domain-containing protein [Rhodopirellula maiorica]